MISNTYPIGGIIQDLEDYYLEETTYKLSDSPLYGNYLFDYWVSHNFVDDKLLSVRNIIKTHTDKLNIMKDNLYRWEEERWTDAEMRECENMIKTLASILSDLNKTLI